MREALTLLAMPAVRRGSITDKIEGQILPSTNYPTRNNLKEENNSTTEAVEQGENVPLFEEGNLALPTTAEYTIEEPLIEDDESREKVLLAVENERKRFSVVSLRSANSRRMEYVQGGYHRFVWNFRTTFLLFFIIFLFILIFFNIYRVFSIL